MIAFGDRVREARQRIRTQAGGRLTQSDLAIAVGVERNTVSRWENSGVCPKDPQVIRKLAAVLHVSMDWLLSDAMAEGSAGGGAGGEAAGQTWFGGSDADRVVRIPSAASEVVAYRIPPVAYERLHGYIERAEQAGATVGQAEEVARLLVDAAANRLRTRPPRERAIGVVVADIDAAWRYASSVLRSEGLTTAEAVVESSRADTRE